MGNDFVKYNLPETWVWTTIGELGIVVSGGTPSTKEPRFWGGEIPWITPADLSTHKEKYITKGNRYITQLGLENSSAVLLPIGTILFSSRAPIGYVTIARTPLATNQGFKNLIPLESTNSEYLYYYLRSAKQLAEKMASGTTFLELSASAFNKIPVPLPPLAEQKRIVSRIEELFSQIEKSIESLQKSQFQLEVYKHALLQDVFAGRLTSKWREINKPTPGIRLYEQIKSEQQKCFNELITKWENEVKKWEKEGKRTKKPVKPRVPKIITRFTQSELSKLPEIPKEWMWVKVDDILQYGRECAYGVLQPGKHYGNGVPLIRVGDIIDGKINQLSLKKISPAIAERYKRTLLEGNEVLITLVGAIGRTAVVPQSLKGANIARAVAVMPISLLINPFYYELSFRRPSKIQELNQLAHEVARKTLNLEDVRKTSVPLCSKEEQQYIASLVDSKLTILESLQKTLLDSFERSKVLRESIFKKAFTGKLNTYDSKDFLASNLIIQLQEEKLKYLKNSKKKTSPKKKMKMNILNVLYDNFKEKEFSFEEIRTKVQWSYQEFRIEFFKIIEEGKLSAKFDKQKGKILYKIVK